MEVLPVISNLLIAVCAAGAIYVHSRKSPLHVIMRYFTALSNVFCAAASLAVAIGRLAGSVPTAVLVFKYVGTVAVTITLLTVIFFLGPTIGYKVLLTGPDFWLHIFCPVLAIVSFVLWDKADFSFGVVFLGTLTVILYGALYARKVILAPEGERWDDFYGFNRNGMWKASYAVMTAGAFIVSLVLWLI